jgi:potassium-transporting ATPase KdpC subunit
MRRQALASIRMLLVITLVVGVAYPLVTTAVAQVAMSHRANGSFVQADGRVVGSELIGQAFEGPEWFHGRPDPFDPTASAPSNLGPTNPELGRLVRERLDAIRAHDDPQGPVPVDAVTGSGSGLDPDISPAYARLQAARVATARGIPADRVLALVDQLVQGRQLGFLGDPHVNVLMLNLALERLAR